MSVNARRILALLLVLASASIAEAQELEPRRWSHLPIATNFVGAGYVHVDGELALDPVLRIEDAEFTVDSWAGKYVRTFELLGRAARIDLAGIYQDGTWEGTLDGVPARVDRRGWADPVVRLAVNLYGAPPLSKAEFASYRAGLERETIVGAGLVVNVPLGQYFDDKLINLGTNRFTIRPQLGVVHNRGKWSFELTGATWIFTDNDDFFGGKNLEQDPFFTIQGHVVYSFRPGLFIASGIGYGIGQESTVDGQNKDDRKQDVVWAVSVGYPVTRFFGLKVGYIGARRLANTGTDSDRAIAVASFFF